MSIEKAKEAFALLVKEFEGLCYIPQVGPENGDPHASQYFGAPWMHKDEPWPKIGGRPAQFVLQLNVSTLPHLVRSLLGEGKLLQMFYADDRVDFADDLSQMAHVRLVTSLEGGGPREQPTGIEGVIGEPRAILGWASAPEYPHPESSVIETDFAEGVKAINKLFGVDILKEVGTTEGEADADDTYQGDKLSGWPWWTQGDETPLDSRGEKMIPLYQLDAGCFFDKCKHVPAYAPKLFAAEGTGHIFVSNTDPTELKFLWAC